MRISDWSSDVCSSDLRPAPIGDALLDEGFALDGHALERPGDRQGILVVHRHAPFEMIAQEDTHRPDHRAADRPEIMLLVGILADALVEEAVLEQIGRASCRERVCQYV